VLVEAPVGFLLEEDQLSFHEPSMPRRGDEETVSRTPV
jgi:hypothetical protein